MRSTLLACSLALVGFVPSPAIAKTNVSVFVGTGPSTQASWQIVTDAGCTQQVTFTVSSSRFLTVDTATRTVQKDTFDPGLVVSITQFDSPGCESFTISDFVDVTSSQFRRNGVSSARLDVEDVVLSDPLAGTYVIDAHLRWTGTGRVTVTPSHDRFCDPEAGLCILTAGATQSRAANVTGTVTATIDPPFGPVTVEDYSPSAGTNVVGRLEHFTAVNVTTVSAP